MKYLEILVKLRKIIRSVNLESKKIEKAFGVSITQLLVLQYLAKQEDYRATLKMIGQYINLNASTVSGIISRLETKLLVARLQSPTDRRAVYVTLTAKGADLLKTSPITLQEKLSARLRQLSNKQISDLNENIELLIRLMDAEEVEAYPVITNRSMEHKIAK